MKSIDSSKFLGAPTTINTLNRLRAAVLVALSLFEVSVASIAAPPAKLAKVVSATLPAPDNAKLLDAILAKVKTGQTEVRVDDMILSVARLHTLRAGYNTSERHTRSAFYPTTRWTNGKVFYQLDSALPQAQADYFVAACREWEKWANLQFAPRTTEANYIHVYQDAGGGSFSDIGMKGGAQDLSLASWATKYSACHEIAHALGVMHEQSRSDRDSYVSIDVSNVTSGYEGNFAIVSDSDNRRAYDFDSVMHYPETAFAVDSSKPTIICKPGYTQFQDTMGQRDHLSANDEAGMADIYGAPIPPATSGALISQYRFGGPGGALDEFIELANTTNAPLNVNGWTLEAGIISVAVSGNIPAYGHLLLANSGYSLGALAAPDVTYAGDIPDSSTRGSWNASGTTPGITLVLRNADGTIVNFVPPFSYPASATAEYAYVRRLESGAPSNTHANNSSGSDFNLVDTSVTVSTVGASGVGNFGPRLGSPNPHNLASTVQHNEGISNAPLYLPGLGTFARYASKGSGVDSKGRLSARRTITNNTGASVSKLRFRIVAITAGSSTASGVADLHAISSGGVKFFDPNNGGALTRGAYGMTIDSPTTPTEAPLTAASSGNGGGLNAGWTAPLPGGTLATGASVNVEFLFGIQAEGSFRVVVDAELLP